MDTKKNLFFFSLGRLALLSIALFGTLLQSDAQAQFGTTPGARGLTDLPQADDYRETPFTQYGEFNEAESEAKNIEFFQYGRFFGVSAGIGNQSVTGNRGLLWQGGFPLMDFQIHAWFDLQSAIVLNFFNVRHTYDLVEKTDVAITHLGVHFKYYIDTTNLAAPISFANPYVLLGAGAFHKVETGRDIQEEDSTYGLGAGGGLEFTISPQNTYLTMELRGFHIAYNDMRTDRFQSSTPNKPNIQDLSGLFFTFTMNLLFTW
jgi:hypothetical protein